MRRLTALLVAAFILLPGIARSDISCSDCDNVQEGQNSAHSDQDGSARAGATIGGQSISVSAGGGARVNATNNGERVRVKTGDATGSNDLSGIVGHTTSIGTSVGSADIVNASGNNVHEGDNEFEFGQTVDATTGDAVAGQIIGVSAGGDAEVIADNTLRRVDVDTGDAEANNDASTLTGQATAAFVVVAGIINPTGNNIQEGNNSLDGGQNADVHTGDGIAGQDLAVSAGGAAVVSASNDTRNVTVSTGDADADNDSAAFVGQATAFGVFVSDDIVNSTAPNIQQGDNTYDVDQSADASSGDALTGQRTTVTGRRHVDVTLDSRGEDNSVSAGEADIDQDEDVFVGAVVGLFVSV